MKELEALRDFARYPYTWPGGYPCYAVTMDGGILSHKAVVENYRLIYRATKAQDDRQWAVAGVDINWENEMWCDHLGIQIKSAYGD